MRKREGSLLRGLERKGFRNWEAYNDTNWRGGKGVDGGSYVVPRQDFLLIMGENFIIRNSLDYICKARFSLSCWDCTHLLHSQVVKMSTPARKRLMRDFKRLQQDPPAGISGAPQDNNIMLWNAVIFGPDDTPWDGGTFKLTLQFTEDYPNKPPTVRFVSRMFHPNIYADGSICLDILQNQWSPIYDVAAILTSIQSLLCDPNPNSPANSEAARMFSENKREYNRRVREIVEQSWTAD
ncbi:hypothetical protein RIF29_32912 [Crotalaria pallida]|uniref:E2 ubiquitin-conjugating enzyme n=1 Tax=Crotalaria pallida TaxID=3830 RepID=A0AAN9HSG9_CROPI